MSFTLFRSYKRKLFLGFHFYKKNDVVLDYVRHCAYVGSTERKTFYFNSCVLSKLVNKSLPDELVIPEIYKNDLSPLFLEFVELFFTFQFQHTTNTTKHTIRLKENIIVQQRPYQISPKYKEILYTQLDDMRRSGVIEPSNSQYASPIVLVDKQGSKPRFCIDYRNLNKITCDEPSNLPRISETLKDLGSATIFTVFDLKSGYWQIPLDEDSRKYSAFCTPDGNLYQFSVMPFGLKNAPATFQRLMVHEVLAGYVHVFVKVYLDDIIIYSTDFSSHLKHIRLVLERLRLHNLHLSPSKCKVATDNLEYLGHRIYKDLNMPQTKHIEAIR